MGSESRISLRATFGRRTVSERQLTKYFTKHPILFLLETSVHHYDKIALARSLIEYYQRTNRLVKTNKRLSVSPTPPTTPTLPNASALLVAQQTLNTQYLASLEHVQLALARLSTKALLELFEGLLDVEDIGEYVEFGDAKKQKLAVLRLRFNLLFVTTVKKKTKTFVYLYKPTVTTENETTVVIDQKHVFKFSNKELATKFVTNITSNPYWYEVVPRFFISTPEKEKSKKGVVLTTLELKKEPKKAKAHSREVTASFTSSPRRPSKHHTGHKAKTPANKVQIFKVSLLQYGETHHTDEPPPPIVALIDSLTRHGPDVEGVFRVPGDQDRSNRLIEILETVPFSPDDFAKFDVHDLATTLKTYIRQFPQCFIPQTVNDEFRILLQQQPTLDDAAVCSEFLRIAETMPAIVLSFFKKLMKLCHMITLKADSNKMKVDNLIICLGPCIKCLPFILLFAIVHYPELWDD